jgi:hypothetical protein
LRAKQQQQQLQKQQKQNYEIDKLYKNNGNGIAQSIIVVLNFINIFIHNYRSLIFLFSLCLASVCPLHFPLEFPVWSDVRMFGSPSCAVAKAYFIGIHKIDKSSQYGRL